MGFTKKRHHTRRRTRKMKKTLRRQRGGIFSKEALQKFEKLTIEPNGILDKYYKLIGSDKDSKSNDTHIQADIDVEHFDELIVSIKTFQNFIKKYEMYYELSDTSKNMEKIKPYTDWIKSIDNFFKNCDPKNNCYNKFAFIRNTNPSKFFPSTEPSSSSRKRSSSRKSSDSLRSP